MAPKQLLILLIAFFLLLLIACDSDNEKEDLTNISEPGTIEDDDDTFPEIDDDSDDDDTINGDDDADDDDLLDGCITGDFEPVWGMLHSHSLFSDGRGTPEEAYTWAKNQGGLDFFALTDHMEMLYIPLPPEKFETLLALADQFYEPGSYVAMAGFEYSLATDFAATFEARKIISAGHINVFYSEELFPMVTLDYRDFYKDLLECPSCLAQFNHPSYDGQTNWDGFEYYPKLDPQINLIEMSTWDYYPWEELFQCLDQGWHVSPTWNQDNHSKEWGTEDDYRTGAWVDELTREGIREAMVEHRMFSTQDKNAAIRLMAADVCWMGSEVQDTLRTMIYSEAIDWDSDDGFETIELYGPGGEFITDFDCLGMPECSAYWQVHFDDAGYIIARAIQMDGDELISSPIWLKK